MQTDPSVYIVSAAVIGACLGFMACALMTANRLRRAARDAWREAAAHYDRPRL